MIVQIHRAGNLLGQHDVAGLDMADVETHVKVGGASSAFHIESLHGVVGVILEDNLSVIEVLSEKGFRFFIGSAGIALFVIGSENVA